MCGYSRVLVTDGAGFIGSYKVDWLLEEGFEDVVLDDLRSGRLDNILANILGRRIFVLFVVMLGVLVLLAIW